MPSDPVTDAVLASLTEDDFRVRETAVRADHAAHELRGEVDGLLADRITLRRRVELLEADQTISDRLRDRVVDLATELAAEKAHAADTIKELAAERDTAQALAHRAERDLRESLDREDRRPNLVELIHELRTVLHGRSVATGETPQEAWTATMADVRAVVAARAELRSTVADLEERLIAACGRETDRTAERDTAQARVAELEEIAATTIAGHAQAMVDQGHQLDTALAALEALTVAAAQYTAAGKVSSSEELFAASLLDVAHRGAVALLRRHDDSPMVAVSRADLSLLIGGLDEMPEYGEELSGAYLRAAALLQPAQGTGQIVLGNEIRDVEQVTTGGAT